MQIDKLIMSFQFLYIDSMCHSNCWLFNYLGVVMRVNCTIFSKLKHWFLSFVLYNYYLTTWLCFFVIFSIIFIRATWGIKLRDIFHFFVGHLGFNLTSDWRCYFRCLALLKAVRKCLKEMGIWDRSVFAKHTLLNLKFYLIIT